MSKLLKKEAALLNQIEEVYPGVIFDLKLSAKKLTLVGPKDVVDKADAEIMKHVSEFSQSYDKCNEIQRECPMCCDDIIHGYKLEFCGHKLCLKCLESHIRQSIHDITSFPINCPVCDRIPTPISQTDLRNIVPENILAKLWQNSYKHFIAKNALTYRKCPGLGCENIYRITDTEKSWISCTMCSLKYCRKCEQTPEILKDADDVEVESLNFGSCKNCDYLKKKEIDRINQLMIVKNRSVRFCFESERDDF